MTESYRVEGMVCVHCVRTVTEALTGVDGVAEVRVDLESGIVELDTSTGVPDQVVRQALDEVGYTVVR